jgi:protein-disulfide isomerase
MRFAAALLLASAVATAQTAPTPRPAAAAPLNLVVFSDFECPYSAELFFSLQRYRQAHPGSLNVIFKNSPLAELHPDSTLAHRAALAAGHQGKFDAMAQLLFANQKHLDRATLLADAQQLHLDLPRFTQDLDSAAVQAELDADLNEAAAFAVDSTPTVYLRGKPLIGVLEEEKLDALLSGQPAAPTPAEVASVVASQEQPLTAAMREEIVHSPAAAERGDAAAPLTIVEFTDFQCPYCRAAAAPLEQFAAAHPKDVHVVLHSFPLDFHPDSELANEAALAAGEQGKFWEMHDLLFAHQDALKLPKLREYAQQLHLDMTAFDGALNTHRFAGSIAADRALGTRAGVDGTPTFFIDGHPLIGAHSVLEWEQLLALHQGPAAAGEPAVIASKPVVPAPSVRVVTGASTAPLVITWFTDVRSPQAATQAQLIRTLSAHYDGKIQVRFKADPLVAMRPDAPLAAAALVAAAEQSKFWPMYDTIAGHKGPLDRMTVLSLAKGLLLNAPAFAKALDQADNAVKADLEEAQRRGILGAPVIFINDRRVDGLQREGFYTAIADEELRQAIAAKDAPGAIATPVN